MKAEELMEDNFYNPGAADLSQRQRVQGSLLKAVSVGLVIDIGGSLVMSVVASAVISFVLIGRGYTPAAIMDYLQLADPFSAANLVIIVLGTVLSVTGGYVCASIANRATFRPVLIMAILSGSIGLLLGLAGGLSGLAQTVALSVLSFASVLAGGWLYQRRNAQAAAH